MSNTQEAMSVIPKVTASELQVQMTMLYGALDRPKPFHLYGPPGCGKSESIYAIARQIAKRTGKVLVFVTVMIASIDMVDTRGPIVMLPPLSARKDAQGNPVETLILDQRMANAPRGEFSIPPTVARLWRECENAMRANPGTTMDDLMVVLFLDEFQQGVMETLRTMAPAVLSNLLGDEYSFPPGTWVVGASNRLEDNSGAEESLRFLDNRWRLYEWRNSAKNWGSVGQGTTVRCT